MKVGARDKAHNAKGRYSYRILIGKPEGIALIGNPGHKSECRPNTEMNLKEIRHEDMNYIHFAQTNMVMNFRSQ
jgi:hypothetical protein